MHCSDHVVGATQSEAVRLKPVHLGHVTASDVNTNVRCCTRISITSSSSRGVGGERDYYYCYHYYDWKQVDAEMVQA